MMIIVAIMSAIIIFGSFKLIVTERLSVIGTFLSQGATKGKVEKILFFESLGYGVVGGIVGNLFGILGLNIVNYLTSPLKEYGIIEKLVINPRYLVSGIIFAIVLSLVSAIIPVKKIKKMQVKDIILNEVNVTNKIGYKKFIAGAFLVVLSIVVNSMKSESFDAVCGVLVILSVLGLILMYPKVVDLISTCLFKILRGKGKASLLALNNLRTSKVLLSNVTLIIISLLAVFMMSSISSSVQDVVSGAFKDMKYDLSISDIPADSKDSMTTADKIAEEVKKNSHIKSNIIHTIQTSAVINNNNYIVEGIDDNYDTYNHYLKFDDKYKEEYDRLIKSDDSVIISTVMNKVFKAKVGDKITVKINDKSEKFTVAGIINEKSYNNGMIAFIRNSVLKDKYQLKDYDLLYLYTEGNPVDVKKELNSTVKKYGATLNTCKEDQEASAKSNEIVMSILSIFSDMAIFIAAL